MAVRFDDDDEDIIILMAFPAAAGRVANTFILTFRVCYVTKCLSSKQHLQIVKTGKLKSVSRKFQIIHNIIQLWPALQCNLRFCYLRRR